MLNWVGNLFRQRNSIARSIPDELWIQVLARYPFVGRRSPSDLMQLRALVSKFLTEKEFSGANGLVLTDEIAVAIALQACLPVLHLGLRWYNDFKGIIVHPGTMVARREVIDSSGVVHNYEELLSGEAMQKGPVTLSWQDAADAGRHASRGYNVVIHEFIHKIDMRDGAADGCPPLATRAARDAWHAIMQPSYDSFCEQVVLADRFGLKEPWLDAYGATSPAEFFAVACEGYFVNRERFTQDFIALTGLFDRFFKPD